MTRTGAIVVGVSVAAGLAIAVGLLAAGATGPDPVKQRPRRPPPSSPPPPTAGDPASWIELRSGPGLRVRRPRRAWTTSAVAEVLSRAAAAAAAAGGELQVAEIATEVRGAAAPPHVSHRWGRDVDVGYTLDVYPTPVTTPPSAGWIEAMKAIQPWIETIGVHATRLAQLRESGLPLSEWPGHVGHAHVRLRRELTAEPTA